MDVIISYNEDMSDLNRFKFEKEFSLLNNIILQARFLSLDYNIVITNPPYMASSGMGNKLKDYLKSNFPDSKSDLFAVFIERCADMLVTNGFYAMITQQSFMFLSSYEKLRKKFLNDILINMVHLGAHAFEEIGGEVVQTTSFISRNLDLENYNSIFYRLVDFNQENLKEEEFFNEDNKIINSLTDVGLIPGSPIAYWADKHVFDAFDKGNPLKFTGDTRQGMATSDNNRFLRFWYELEYSKLGFNCSNAKEALNIQKKWYPYNKGGHFRKWWGNQDYMINYENDGLEVKDLAKQKYNSVTRTIKSISEYFKPCLSWSKISSGAISFRYYPKGFIFDVAGCCI